ncbi:MAG: hypothetical protein EP329_16000 [Deltaproteobacteria bacterium]|nr:MAG: hypothetical protein EP329_16000 [Deltaproteobacteria bacterium]
MIRERAASEKWDGLLIVDTGDAFSPTPSIIPSRRDAWGATSEFIVDQYSAGEVAAMTLGDRDLSLGLDAVRALAKRARFPFISANLVSEDTKTPIFPTHVIVERAGLKIGLLGLMSPSGARGTVAAMRGEDGKLGWEATDPVPAAKAAVAALIAEGADVIVALSHLTEQEQAAVSSQVPSIRVFVGSQSMGGMRSPGGTVSPGVVAAQGGMKGKQVAFLTLRLGAGTGTNAPIVDKDRRKGLEDRLARARVRVESLDKRITLAKSRADEPETPPAPGAKLPSRRIKPPISMWEQQLAGARAEVQLIEADLKALDDAPETPGNSTHFELVNLGNNVTDDPTVKAAVDAFRVKVPDPTKQPPRTAPEIRHPGKGIEIKPPTPMKAGPTLKPVQPVRRPLPVKKAPSPTTP